MSDDGAQLRIGAEAALHAILGGEQPTERETAEQMAASIMALTEDPHTYDGTARWCAQLIVRWLQADPSRAQGPVENVYALHDDGRTNYAVVAERGWYYRMKADGVPLDTLGLSGFMWGWAVNAARRCVELPEVPNPAIVTIG